MGELARATLTPLDPFTGARGASIDICFNPKEYSLDKNVAWNPVDTKGDAQTIKFDKPSPMTMSVTLQFDTYEERVSVRDKYVRKIEALTLVNSLTDTTGILFNTTELTVKAETWIWKGRLGLL